MWWKEGREFLEGKSDVGLFGGLSKREDRVRMDEGQFEDIIRIALSRGRQIRAREEEPGGWIIRGR